MAIESAFVCPSAGTASFAAAAMPLNGLLAAGRQFGSAHALLEMMQRTLDRAERGVE